MELTKSESDFLNAMYKIVYNRDGTERISVDRLRELAEADKDGRLVVLPCKMGDKVFVRADTWGNTWNFVTVDCGKFLVGEIIGFAKTRNQTLMKIQVEHNVSWKKERKRYPVSALGLTVFLTHKAALKAGEPR